MVRIFLPALFVLASCPGLGAFAATRTVAPATPRFHIPLERLGYRPVTSAILQREGYSMSTVDFIDDDHVLLTFNARKLVQRMPEEDREGEQARLVRALVLHLPDGKVLHEAEWRTHDHNRYLWPLHDGKFLLRVRNQLSMVRFVPGHEGLQRHPLLEAKGEIEALQVSPAGDVLLVETSPEKHIGDDPTVPLEEKQVKAAFYRIRDGEYPALRLLATSNTEKPFYSAFTSHGFLSSTREDREHWGFDFHPFSSEDTKPMELAGLLTTCQPHPEFLSEATFIATGCRGGEDRRLLAGFDLNAEADWVFTTDDAPVWQSLSSAPAAGRFALRTTMLTGVVDPSAHVGVEDVRAQDVRVYNFRGGTELLRASSRPVQHAGQNFSLSPDGMTLVVLRDSELDVYQLPPLNDADRKSVLRAEEPLKKLKEPPDTEVKLAPAQQPRR